MQMLLVPATRSGFSVAAAASPFPPPHRHRPPLTSPPPNLLTSLETTKLKQSFSPLASWNHLVSSSSVSSPSFTSSNDDTDKAKLSQVAKRLETTSRYFKRLGNLGYWENYIACYFYATAGGIIAAFISVFWSFGYIRLSEKLKRTANDPSKAPPRADVVKSLKNGIVLNLLGMGAAILGMQATVGLLVAKALTTSTTPYYQGIAPGSSPVLALDVFLVQASANTILSHFLGLVFSLELLRSVTLPNIETIPIPKIA
ncbi:Protein TIC 21 [Hibiscus syriacus]|uniref:Protein TIC 21 n=1 Tax=Hibiscus syriacus TaxID=106335 RepID=A0A6A2Y7W1_HIBSY|nr:Protein TIC 21 [Hibiscus syriacus]